MKLSHTQDKRARQTRAQKAREVRTKVQEAKRQHLAGLTPQQRQVYLDAQRAKTGLTDRPTDPRKFLGDDV